jgi:hypothetical protein
MQQLACMQQICMALGRRPPPAHPATVPGPCLQRAARDEAKTAMYHLKDELRSTRVQAEQLQQQLGHAQGQLALADATSCSKEEELQRSQEQLQVRGQRRSPIGPRARQA